LKKNHSYGILTKKTTLIIKRRIYKLSHPKSKPLVDKTERYLFSSNSQQYHATVSEEPNSSQFLSPIHSLNMALSLSPSSLLVLCMLLILQLCTFLAVRQNHATELSRKIGDIPDVLPNGNRRYFPKIPSLSVSGQTIRLLFHHNVSLAVSLSVGSPPQDVSMVLDTGSELSWLACNSSYPAYFKAASSTTYSAIPCNTYACQMLARDLPIPPVCDQETQMCNVLASYADASTSSGVLSSDFFHLGNSDHSIQQPLLFGCMDSTVDFTSTTPTTGLLGMNRGSLSFITQSGKHQFAYCISHRDGSGILLLGDDASLPPLNYTPFVQISWPLPSFDQQAYSVQLEGIRVSNLVLPIPKSVFLPDHTGAGQTMLDSGTQFTFLLGKAYSALKNEFLRQTSNILTELNEPYFMFQGAFDTCFKIPQGQLPPATLPQVTLILQGVEVTVTSELLLYRVPDEVRGADDVWCFTFGNSDLLPLSASVIGHHHQKNNWVKYDLENDRIGFAPARCDQMTQ
jgi:Xylanase inhibitor N-terminal/Xylanase inhibitor C-terminal